MFDKEINLFFEKSIKERSNEFFSYRLLEETDFQKGYFELISQLTICSHFSEKEFKERYDLIKESKLIYVFVIEDLIKKKIVASATVMIEPKFIRGLGLVCHIEDVVVDNFYRKKKFGSELIKICLEFSNFCGCYKTILDCDEKVSKFYENLGFQRRSIGMSLYKLNVS